MVGGSYYSGCTIKQNAPHIDRIKPSFAETEKIPLERLKPRTAAAIADPLLQPRKENNHVQALFRFAFVLRQPYAFRSNPFAGDVQQRHGVATAGAGGHLGNG